MRLANFFIVTLIVGGFLAASAGFAYKLHEYAEMQKAAEKVLSESNYTNIRLYPDQDNRKCLTFSAVHEGQWASRHRYGKVCGEQITVRK